MSKPKFITQYTRESLETPTFIPSEDNVNRQITDDCEINKIFERYSPGDTLPFIEKDLSDYNENISFADLTQARDLLDNAESEFMSLPSAVRKQFGNDLFAYSKSLTGAYSGDLMEQNKLANLGLLSAAYKVADLSGASEISQPGGNVSVITPPGDSKNLNSGSNVSTVNQLQNTPPVNNTSTVGSEV